tara:strand:- start:127 stop:570 length:444 start_codon:yes stop_codon:yes gene_type:complete
VYKGKKINRGYRSGLENKVNEQLKNIGIVFTYETLKIEWEDLAYRKYTPDFILSNGIIIETKGLFTASDRRKHLLIQKQHPELDIRFVFSNCNSKLNKRSKTTYASWCDKHNFLYATKKVPLDWTSEETKILKTLNNFIQFKGIKHE